MEHNPVLPPEAFSESRELFLPSEAGIEPLAAVACALRGFNRDQLGSAIEVLIALMDVADGDPEAENATDAEDDFAISPMAQHFSGSPGCAIGDGGDISAIEWTSTKPYQRSQMEAGKHEDDEEDDPGEEEDPSGQCDEDGINTAQGSVCFTPGARGPGCLISDQGIADSGGFYD